MTVCVDFKTALKSYTNDQDVSTALGLELKLILARLREVSSYGQRNLLIIKERQTLSLDTYKVYKKDEALFIKTMKPIFISRCFTLYPITASYSTANLTVLVIAASSKCNTLV
jgi:hypothetical protein